MSGAGTFAELLASGSTGAQVRSVTVRLGLDPSSYVAGAAKAQATTLELDRAVGRVGTTAATSMEQAASKTTRAESAFGKLGGTTRGTATSMEQAASSTAKAGTAMENAAKSADKTGASFLNLHGIAGRLGIGVGLLAGVTAASVVKMAADFQSSTTRLVTSAGETQANLAMVRQGLLDMAGRVGYSVEALDAAMYKVESGGQHGAAGLTVLEAAAQGAKTENADLTVVADAVTSAMQDYHLKASDAATVTSKLVAATASGKMTFQELAGSMSAILPVASANHVALNDILGDLASMTVHGMSAEQASQNLADAVRHLAAPSQVSQKELALIGFTAQQVSADLSSKGLSGTVQELSKAVMDHMGPGTQKVVLDLMTALNGLDPAVRDLGQKLVDGTISQGDYMKAAKDLTPELQGQAAQFDTLAKSTHGIGNEQMSGRQVMQSYSGAMKALMGDATGMNVALMLTGDNSKTTATAIDNVSKAAADAHGNVQGWDLIQGNFNQQLDQTAGSLQKLAIEAGQHLLPVLTDVLGWVNSDGLPALEHLGGAAGDAAHWFGELPGPVKEAAAALAGLALAEKVGLLDRLSSGLGSVAGGFGKVAAAVKEESALQQWAATVSSITTGAPAAEGGISRIAVAGGLASRAMGTLKSGAMGLMGMFGGPWGAALVGATLGVTALESAIAAHDAQIKKATDDVLAWNKAVSLNPGGQSAVQAQQHLQDLQNQLDAVTKAIHEYNGAANGDTSGAGVYALTQKQSDLTKALADGKKAWQDQLAAMTPVQEMQARVDAATTDLNNALKSNPSNSQAVTNAALRLQEAQHMLAAETINANNATKTQAQLQQDAANAILGTLDASRAAQEATLQFSDAVSQYNSDVADGQHTTRQLKEEQLGLVDSARRTAQAAADAAVAQDKQNGITDTAHDSQVAFLKSLQDSANQMTGPGKQAILDMIAQLGKQQSQAVITSGAISALGVTVTDLPSEHLVHINVPTQQQVDDLHQLGYVTTTLPDHTVVVSADTHPALTEIQDLLNYARQQSIQFRAGLAVTNPLPGTSQRMGTYAEGGYTGAGGKYTPAGFVHAGEIVWSQDDIAAHGGVSAVEAMRTMRGYAAGGVVIPVSIDPSSLAGMRTGVQGLAQQAGAAATAASLYNVPVNPLGNVQLGLQMATAHGWGSMAEWSALYSLWQRESGWRNTAQNPTSTAYGIPQFLDSTWATVGVRKTSDPGTQIAGGLTYIGQRYHDPIGAWAHETRFGWYDQGGPLHPGLTLVANGTGKTETVRTHEQEQAVQARLRTREMSGAALGGGAGAGAANVVVNARVFVGDREITDIARVEAENVTAGALTALTQRQTY